MRIALILVFFIFAGCQRTAESVGSALFIGDSITANWAVATIVPRAVNSGAAGETSINILKRAVPQMNTMRPDFVHILAGTNDQIDTQTFRSVRQVLGLGYAARSAGASMVVIGTIPPLDAKLFPMQQANASRFNMMLSVLARLSGFKVADYNTAMSLPNGDYRAELFIDGIHPNERGYVVMRAVLNDVIKH